MKQPLSTQQKQVETPQASISDALNLTKNAQEAFRPVFQAIKDLSNATSEKMQFDIRQRKSDEQLLANEAITAYKAQRELLDSELFQKKGENAISHKDKYYSDSDLAHQKFVMTIDGIKDPTIRENARRQINDYNISEAQRAGQYLYNEDVKSKIHSTTAKIELDNNTTLSKLTGNTLDDLVTVKKAIQEAEADIRMMGTLLGTSENEMLLSSSENASKLTISAANEILRKYRPGNQVEAYELAHRFLENADSFMITESEKKEQLRDIEKERLQFVAMSDISSLMSGGKIDYDNKVSKLTPNLTPEERRLVLKESQSSTGSNKLSDFEKSVLVSYRMGINRDLKNKNELLGMMTKEDYSDTVAYMSDEAKEKFNKELQTRKNDAQIYDIVNHIFYLQQLSNVTVFIDEQGSVYSSLKADGTTDEQKIKEYMSNGYKLVQHPLNGDAIANEIDRYENFLFDKLDVKKAWNKKEGLFKGYNLNAFEAMLKELMLVDEDSRTSGGFLGMFEDVEAKDKNALVSAIIKLKQNLDANGLSDDRDFYSLSQQDQAAAFSSLAKALEDFNGTDFYQRIKVSLSNSYEENMKNIDDNVNKTLSQRLQEDFYNKERPSGQLYFNASGVWVNRDNKKLMRDFK